MDYDIMRVDLPLKKTFAISGGAADTKTNLLALMNNRYAGEAAGSVAYGPAVEEMEEGLRSGIDRLQDSKDITVDSLRDIATFDLLPAVRAALSGMVLHYLSGEAKVYPWEVLSLGAPVGAKTSVTVAIDEPQAMLKAIAECDNPIVKIKLGGEHDLEVVKGLKDIQGKLLRVDANGAWSPEAAEEMIFYLGKAGVTQIEQPTEIAHVKEWPRLKSNWKQAEFILDEGLNDYEDYLRNADYIDGVNIKMEKCGGIVEGIKIASVVRADRRKVMLGCMVASSIGMAQSLYMSSLADYCDLDGPLLLEEDIADGIRYDRESIEVDREIIGGPKLKRELIEKYIQTQ